MFSARAALAVPGFVLTAAHAAAVQHICAQLDGMPLAIELAAARVKVLSPPDIAARLSDRFRLLTGGSRTALPRHQTLRAMIDWSYQLLTEPEHCALRRLSAFAGGWTMEAAEAVCQGDEIAANDVLDLLARLVDKSLVLMSEHDGVTRYHLLETIRQYAAERLEEAGESTVSRNQHLNYFLGLGERVELQLDPESSVDQVSLLKRLERDLDNIRRALDWATETGQIGTGLRLVTAIADLFIVRAGQKEVLARLRAMIEHPAAPRNTRVEALTYLFMFHLHDRQGDFDLAKVLLERAEAVVLALDDLSLRARILVAQGGVAQSKGDYVLARMYFNQWRELLLSNGRLGLNEETYAELETFHDGMLSLAAGDYARAADKLTSVHNVLVQRGNQVSGTAIGRALGYALLNIGQFGDAADRFRESLIGNFALGDSLGVAACLAAWAAYALSQEDLYAAASLFGASEAIQESVYTPLMSWDITQVKRQLVTLCQQLDPAELAAHWAAGRALTLEQAVDFVLSSWPTGHT